MLDINTLVAPPKQPHIFVCVNKLNVWLTIFDRARADSDHQYTIPQASYTSSTRTRLSHAYECLPYATMTASVATVESPSDGYLDLTAYDDYLKPVDEVVYYSINDDSAELATL